MNEEGGFSAAFLRSAQREAEMAASRAKESPGIEAGGSPGETSHLQSESGDRQPAGEETASAERRSAAERTMERGGIAASAAVPYGLTYRGEGAVTALSGGAAGVSGSGESSGGEKGAAEDWSRRWERDCRRYDGGFPTA